MTVALIRERGPASYAGPLFVLQLHDARRRWCGDASATRRVYVIGIGSPTFVRTPFWTMKNCTVVPNTGFSPGGQSAETLSDGKTMLPPFGVIGALTACLWPLGSFPFPLVAQPAATSMPTCVGSVPTPAILPPVQVTVVPSVDNVHVGVPWTKWGLAACAVVAQPTATAA